MFGKSLVFEEDVLGVDELADYVSLFDMVRVETPLQRPRLTFSPVATTRGVWTQQAGQAMSIFQVLANGLWSYKSAVLGLGSSLFSLHKILPFL